MRKRTLTAVTASLLIAGLMTTGAAALAVTHGASVADRGTFIDGVPTPNDDTFIDGVPSPVDEKDGTADDGQGAFVGGQPAPLIVSPDQLGTATITLAPDQALVVVQDAENGGLWTGRGGSADDAVLRFEPAVDGGTDDDPSFNAAFFAGGDGTTTAWIVGPDGKRIAFEVTVAAS